MLSENVKLSFEDIIASLHNLNKVERIRLQTTLFELQSDLDLKEAILEGLADKRSGRVSSHDEILREIRAKHQQ
jgi:hypothetical protein